MDWFLMRCFPGYQPADFMLVAQHPETYELLGYTTDTNQTVYIGDFSGFKSRMNPRESQLGVWVGDDLGIDGYWETTLDTVKQQFNAMQDRKRLIEYRDIYNLAGESQYKTIDPDVSEEEAQAANDAYAAAVRAIKNKYPKVT